ncbi:hypothetical protein [Helicobacter sp. T3_23-1059]
MENFIISISASKKSVYLFCDNNSTIDCYTIHNQIYQSIKNNTNNTINDESNNITNITKEDLQNYNIYVFLDSILLIGGIESTLPHNELFFGSLTSNDSQNPNFNDSNTNHNASDSNALDSNLSANDSNLANTDSTNDLDESKPIYYLEYDLDCLDSNAHSQDSNKSNKSNFDSNKSNSNLNSKDSNKSYKSSDSNLKSNDSKNSNNNVDSLDSHDSNKSYKSNVDSNHSNDSNNSTNTNNSTQTNNTTKIYPTNQTLQIFLNNHRLTILHYSLLDSSLNIKLECKSKESNAIKDNEINQRNKDKQQSNTPTISTAFLCPILECDELKCIHGGQVKLKSNLGKKAIA